MKVSESVSHSVVSDSLRLHELLCQATLSMEFSGKNTEVGCHFLLQGIFPTHGLNLSHLHCKETLYHLGQQGSHHIYEKIFFRTLYYTLKCPVIVQKPVSSRNPAENIFQTGFITSSQHTQMLSYIHYLLTIF